MKKISLLLITIIAISLFSCTKVDNLGVFGKSRMKDVLGQDGVTPIPISENITMWTFGDTILGTWKEDVSVSATFSERAAPDNMISNSLAFTERPSSGNVKNLKFTYLKEKGKVCQFIKLKKTEDPRYDRLWALDGIKTGSSVYIYYLRIRIGGKEKNKEYGFKMDAVGLAKWQMPGEWKTGGDVSFIRLKDLFPADTPGFGASVIEKNGFIYTVGQYTTTKMTSPVKIARVKTEELENPDAYQYLGRGGKWVARLENALPLLNDVMGECSLSYNEYLQKYVIIYCQLFTGKIVMVRFSDFSELDNVNKEIIYQMPGLKPEKEKNTWYYSGKEIFSEDDDIYAICINPQEYQPYLLKIDIF